MKTYLSIQYLRGVAALAVVAFHTSLTGPLGQAGVDVFFVISGFVMSLVIQRENRPGDFMLRRLARIWPLYAIATLVMAVHNQADIRALLLSLSFIPHRDPVSGQNWPVLVQGWTLNFEMFFYFMMALCLFLPARRQAAALTVMIVALVIAGALFQPRDPLMATYTGRLLLEFLAGVWIGRLSAAGRLPGPAIGGALIAASLAAFAFTFQFNGDADLRVLIWGAPSALLVIGALSLDQAGKVADIKPLRVLGDASYSIYLFHPFIMKTAERALSFLPAPLTVLGVMAIAALAGAIAYYALERPIMSLLRRWMKKAPKPASPEAAEATS